MLLQLQQLLCTDNENGIIVITISPHSQSPQSHPSQFWHCKGLVISYSRTATALRLVKLKMLPHWLFQYLFYFSDWSVQVEPFITAVVFLHLRHDNLGNFTHQNQSDLQECPFSKWNMHKHFFQFLQPISRFGLYLGNETWPNGTFWLGMPQIVFSLKWFFCFTIIFF